MVLLCLFTNGYKQHSRTIGNRNCWRESYHWLKLCDAAIISSQAHASDELLPRIWVSGTHFVGMCVAMKWVLKGCDFMMLCVCVE